MAGRRRVQSPGTRHLAECRTPSPFRVRGVGEHGSLRGAGRNVPGPPTERPPTADGGAGRWRNPCGPKGSVSRLRALRAGGLPAVVAVALMAVVSCSVAGPSAPPSACLTVGAWVPGPEDPGEQPLARFAQVDQEIGPLTMRRSFDSTLPSSFATSAAGDDPAAGLRSFVSWKPPGGDHRGAAAGRYDQQIARWARSVPATGVFATAFHEPENDMTAEEFVSFQRHVYGVVKNANPTIHWGPVYMAYWWDPAEPDHYVGDPNAWWPGAEFADFVGLDWYGNDPQPMTTSATFRHWHDAMAPTGLPLVIAEYGQAVGRRGQDPDPDRERARALAILEDAEWIAEHPQIVGWLYWQGFGHRGTDWRLTDRASQVAWRAAASRTCRQGPSRGVPHVRGHIE